MEDLYFLYMLQYAVCCYIFILFLLLEIQLMSYYEIKMSSSQ